MWKSIFRSLAADSKLILQKPLLLFASLSPFILILLLLPLSPLLCKLLSTNAGDDPHGYFEIIAITSVSVIPLISGILYAAIVNTSNESSELKILFFARMTACFSASVLTVLLAVIILNPVLTEGWLRTIFVSFLFSFQTIFAFLLLVWGAGNRQKTVFIVCLWLVFLASVPYGLVFHRPWTYIAFISPFYWISWAWVVPDRMESLVYGVISLMIASGCSVLLLRKILKGIQER